MRRAFAVFWATKTDPTAKRQLLNLIFGGVWLDQDRVVGGPAQALVPGVLPATAPRTGGGK
jgi:hypothetical protein